MIAMIEPDLEANPENSGSISSINPTVDPAEDLQHAAIDAVQFDNKLLRIGRKMVNESCNHKWCTILRNECFQKFSDQCGSGCHEICECWDLSRCETIKSLATYGFFCLPCWIILPFFVIGSFFVDSSSCSSQSTENKLLPTSASTCERACGFVQPYMPVISSRVSSSSNSAFIVFPV